MRFCSLLAQSDNVIEILDSTGATVVKYVYDAWGNHDVLDYTDFGLGELNPIRYRSYYYDTETGLYYLQSRYYDPEVGRFISMDDINYLDPKTIGGVNLYAYCLNNPVMYVDPTGHSAIVTALIIGAIVGACIGFGAATYVDYSDDGQVFNGSVAWYNYLGATVTGGIIGGAIGAGIGYIATTIPSMFSSIGSFLNSSFTLGSLVTVSGEIVTISITGAQMLEIASLLGISFALIGKSGGYKIEHHYPNDHDPKHVHISGDDGVTKVDVNGNPIQGNRPMTHGEKKAFKKLLKEIIKALTPWM